MAYRPTWQGHLRLSLVTCPVALYTATSSGGDVHFNLINPKTNNRIKMITTDPETGPIERSDLVKGYEVSKGEYVRADGLAVPSHANLAHALLARICWSSSREVGMVCADDYRPQLTAGTWAGDRFCVTSLDVLPETEMDLSDEKREWRDVTREVSEVLAHIWEKNSARWIVFCK